MRNFYPIERGAETCDSNEIFNNCIGANRDTDGRRLPDGAAHFESRSLHVIESYQHSHIGGMGKFRCMEYPCWDLAVVVGWGPRLLDWWLRRLATTSVRTVQIFTYLKSCINELTYNERVSNRIHRVAVQDVAVFRSWSCWNLQISASRVTKWITRASITSVSSCVAFCWRLLRASALDEVQINSCSFCINDALMWKGHFPPTCSQNDQLATSR